MTKFSSTGLAIFKFFMKKAQNLPKLCFFCHISITCGWYSSPKKKISSIVLVTELTPPFPALSYNHFGPLLTNNIPKYI